MQVSAGAIGVGPPFQFWHYLERASLSSDGRKGYPHGDPKQRASGGRSVIIGQWQAAYCGCEPCAQRTPWQCSAVGWARAIRARPLAFFPRGEPVGMYDE
jgi:hypothetical protein